MKLTQLDHVQIAIPQGGEPKAIDFFGRLLGLHQVEKPKELRGRGGCWFEADTFLIHAGIDHEFTSATKAHLAFCVDGLDALADLLASEGFPTSWDETFSDRKRFYSEDPFGNRIEFIEAGAGFLERPLP